MGLNFGSILKIDHSAFADRSLQVINKRGGVCGEQLSVKDWAQGHCNLKRWEGTSAGTEM